MGDGNLYIGVDVGTGSVRAALVNSDGVILTTSQKDIKIWEPAVDFYEQSSEDIWNTVCHIVKTIIDGVDVSKIRGIGFDATCSLVVLDTNFQPLTLSASESSYYKNGPQGNRELHYWCHHIARQ
ncbi:FGGY carbohydrate kinase domain-containing protein-like [Glandiceps talaboti]